MEFKEFTEYNNPEEQDYDINSSLNSTNQTTQNNTDDQSQYIPDDIPEDVDDEIEDIKPTSVFDSVEELYKRSSR